jgi:ring-1,2-phenylacetyl-CoA epoxidase subunit PaaC
VARLAQTPAGRDALRNTLTPAWQSCLRWFGGPDGGLIVRLAAAGVSDAGPEELRARWIQRVGPIAGEADLGLAEAAADGTWRSAVGLDWSDWDTSRRRSGGGSLNAETLAGVRGDKNRTMLMD